MLFISIVYPLVTRFFLLLLYVGRFGFLLFGPSNSPFVYVIRQSISDSKDIDQNIIRRDIVSKDEKEIGDTNTKTPTAGHSLLEQTITRWKKASSSSANRTSKEKAITLLCIGLNLILGKES